MDDYSVRTRELAEFSDLLRAYLDAVGPLGYYPEDREDIEGLRTQAIDLRRRLNPEGSPHFLS